MNVFNKQCEIIDEKTEKIIKNIENKTNDMCKKLDKRNKWLKFLWITYTLVMIMLIGIFISAILNLI